MARALNIIFLLLPLLLFFATKALSPLLAILAVAMLAATRMESVLTLRNHKSLLVLLGLVLVWPLATTLWAPDAGQTFSSWSKVALMCLAGAYLFVAVPKLPSVPVWVVRTMAIILISVMGVFALEVAAGIPVVKFLITTLGGDYDRFMIKSVNRGLCAIAMLVWPLWYGLTRNNQRPLAWAMFLITAVTVLSLDSISAKIGLLGGGAVWLALTLLPRITSRALQMAIPAAFLLVPALTYWVIYAPELEAARSSFAAFSAGRMPIWQSLIENSHAHWLMGWGVTMTPNIPYNANLPDLIPFYGAPLHPHHSALQVVIELGAIGLVLFTAALALLARNIGNVQDSAARHAGFAFLATYLLTGLFSFGIWQNWWIACGWLAAILWQRFRAA